jgi:hypothetical protein
VPVLSLSIPYNLKLVCRGFLEVLLVRLCQGGSVLPACRAGLVESLIDFTIPPGLSMSLASFSL